MIRLLACADVHLGRQSSHLPEDLAETHTPAAVWDEVISEAIERGVDAVVVTGDLVDEENAFFEAFEPVARGGRRLAEAQIPMVVIGGNHDWDVLERLVNESAGAIRLLGAGGSWEWLDVSRPGGDRVRLFGWSFPRPVVSESPVADFPAADLDPGAINIGLLHADLGASGGPYCPVRRSELEHVGVDAWLLGHVHRPTRPEELTGRPLVIYPGSLQGLDPGIGEMGAHGPWLIECDAGTLHCNQLPMAAVVFQSFPLDVTSVNSVGDLQTLLARSLRERCVEIQAALPRTRCVVMRLVVSGRTLLRRGDIRAQLDLLRDAGQLSSELNLVLDDCSVRTLPPVDTSRFEDESTPLGIAVCLLEELRGDRPISQSTRDRIDALRRRLREFSARTYRTLETGDGDVDEETCRELLAVQAERLVEALYAQKESSHEPR